MNTPVGGKKSKRPWASVWPVQKSLNQEKPTALNIGLSIKLQVVKDGISSPAMRELVESILQTVEDVKSGKKSHNQGLTELSGYKQVVQIMAFEVMRHRIPVRGFLESPQS